jgi:tRNA-binding EMAP/Myf-like protein
MGLKLQIQLGIRIGMYQHIVYKIIAAPNNNNPITPIGFKESVVPLKGVDVGEGMVVRFPGAVPVLKVVEGARVVSTIMVVDPTAEGEDVFPGFTRIVVVVDSGEVSLAVVEAEAAKHSSLKDATKDLLDPGDVT